MCLPHFKYLWSPVVSGYHLDDAALLVSVPELVANAVQDSFWNPSHHCKWGRGSG